jgi:hypothetical protein
MKKSNGKSFLLGLIIFLLNSSIFIPETISQWVLVGNGLINTTFHSLAANSNTIFAGGGISNSIVYKSTNNGTNWTASLTLNVSFYSLAANGNNIFAGSDGLGVYYSSNNGSNWAPTSLNNLTVNALTVNGNRIFAGTNQNGVYITNNNGANWTQTSLNNQSVLSLAVKGDTVFAGTTSSGVYISTDNGTNWTQTSLNNQWIKSLAISGNNIFAGRSALGALSLYFSTDNGTTWALTSLNSNSVWSLSTSGNNVIAATYGTGVYASTDFGTNWTQRNEGLSGMFVRALCISNNYIFACPDSRVYRRPLNELTGIQPVSNEISEHFSISQNYPNPFNPVTNIEFTVPKSSFVKLVIYNSLGIEVETLVNYELNHGTYKADWDASEYPSGVYFYKISAGSFSETKRMILVK